MEPDLHRDIAFERAWVCVPIWSTVQQKLHRPSLKVVRSRPETGLKPGWNTNQWPPSSHLASHQNLEASRSFGLWSKQAMFSFASRSERIGLKCAIVRLLPATCSVWSQIFSKSIALCARVWACLVQRRPNGSETGLNLVWNRPEQLTEGLALCRIHVSRNSSPSSFVFPWDEFYGSRQPDPRCQFRLTIERCHYCCYV